MIDDVLRDPLVPISIGIIIVFVILIPVATFIDRRKK